MCRLICAFVVRIWHKTHFLISRKSVHGTWMPRPVPSEPHHEKTCLCHMRTTKAQISHPRSLISAFVVHCLDSIIPLVSLSKTSSLSLASLAPQAGLSLTWSQTPKTDFSWRGSSIKGDDEHHRCLLSIHFDSIQAWKMTMFKLRKN